MSFRRREFRWIGAVRNTHHLAAISTDPGPRLIVTLNTAARPGAFDLIQHDGEDLRHVPLIDRKRRLAELLGRAGEAIQFVDHLAHDGATVFEHACRMGLEGIVSKRTDAPYRGGPSKTWLKSKNLASEAVRREREEEWR